MSCNSLSYGFGCNVRRPQNPFGRLFGTTNSLTNGTVTDSGVRLSGKGGSVIANDAEYASRSNADAYPTKCFPLHGECGFRY